MRRHVLLLPVLAAAGACAPAAPPASSPAASATAETSAYRTATCPIPPEVRMYTVVTRAEGGTSAGRDYLERLASLVGVHIPGVPRAAHRADVVAVVGDDGRLRRAWLDRRSADRGYDRALVESVEALFTRGSIGTDPGMTHDSLVVRFLFGEEPAAGEWTFRRFSAQWRDMELRTPPGGRWPWPAGVPNPEVRGEVTLWASFPERGPARVRDDPSPRATDDRLLDAAHALVSALEFAPAQSNCEPVPVRVPLRLTFDGGPGIGAEWVRPHRGSARGVTADERFVSVESAGVPRRNADAAPPVLRGRLPAPAADPTPSGPDETP